MQNALEAVSAIPRALVQRLHALNSPAQDQQSSAERKASAAAQQEFDLDETLKQALKDYDNPAEPLSEIEKDNLIKSAQTKALSNNYAQMQQESSRKIFPIITPPSFNFTMLMLGLILTAIIWYIDKYEIFYTKAAPLSREERITQWHCKYR